MPPRGIHSPITTLTRTLNAQSARPSTIEIPDLGSMRSGEGGLLGLHLSLTEDAAANDGVPVSGAKITDAIELFEVKAASNDVILSLPGRELEDLANVLSRRGKDIDAPSPGDGSLVRWDAFIPFSINRGDMVARLNLTWAPITKLYTAAKQPTGGTEIVLEIAGLYALDGEVYTVNIESIPLDLKAGVTPVAHLFSRGDFIEGLYLLPDEGGTNPLRDARFDHLRVQQDNYVLMDNAAVDEVFKVDDILERDSGHNDGHIIYRGPYFQVLDTTKVEVKLKSASNVHMVVVSRSAA